MKRTLTLIFVLLAGDAAFGDTGPAIGSVHGTVYTSASSGEQLVAPGAHVKLSGPSFFSGQRFDAQMINEAVTNKHRLPDAAMKAFLDAPNEESFASLFKILTPQLVAFFRSRGCEEVAEDLAQEVMLTVYRQAGQVRERALFRAWVFRIARNTLRRHWRQRAREVETAHLAEVPERFVASNNRSAGTPAFEFHRWMAFLDSQEREALTLRFIDECEYREIAAAQAIPIGTAQWRVFNAKKKLAPHLKKLEANKTRMVA